MRCRCLLYSFFFSLELEYIETTTEKVLSIKRQIILIAILSHSSPPSPHHNMLEKCGISSFDSTFTRLSLPSNQASHGWKIQIHNFSVRCDFFSFYLSHASTLLYVSELSFVVVSCRLLSFSRELPHSYNCELLSLWCVSL